MSAADSIGMMNKAYAVPRGEILQWVNDLLSIEQMGTGAVYCQVFDVVYPGSIQLTRISWAAKNEYEYVQNYKLLQSGFNKQSQKKYIDVQKLCKCKYQDNLEFAQWLKALYDMHGGYRDGYDPEEKRSGAKVELMGIKMDGGMSTSDKPAPKTKPQSMTLGSKMKPNASHPIPKAAPKIPEHKKENLVDNGQQRPIKRITGINPNPKLNPSEEQIKQIISMVSTDEDPFKTVSEIRELLGVKFAGKNYGQQQQLMLETEKQEIYNQKQRLLQFEDQLKHQQRLQQEREVEKQQQMHRQQQMISPQRHVIGNKQGLVVRDSNVMQEECISNTNITPIKPVNDSSLNNVTAEYDMQLEAGSEGDYDPNASLEFDGHHDNDGQMEGGQDDEIFDIQQAEIIFN